jgi:hypothetical protein
MFWTGTEPSYSYEDGCSFRLENGAPSPRLGGAVFFCAPQVRFVLRLDVLLSQLAPFGFCAHKR